MGLVRSVNLGQPGPAAGGSLPTTGIEKHPTSEPVEIRSPGPKKGGLGSGLVGDHVEDRRHHGGEDQAVYAVARAELDYWATELGRELPDGMFGENLTVTDLAVDDAAVGEIWRIGDTVRLQVTGPRIPCATFAGHMGERRWVKRYADHGRPGAYLRVLAPGEVRAGDPIVVEHRPEHEVTVAAMFRALTTHRDEMPTLARAGDDLPGELREQLDAWHASTSTGTEPP